MEMRDSLIVERNYRINIGGIQGALGTAGATRSRRNIVAPEASRGT